MNSYSYPISYRYIKVVETFLVIMKLSLQILISLVIDNKWI